MRARPKPLLGAVLGLMLALASVVLLSVLGVLPADRTIVWGAAAMGLLAGGAMLTQRIPLARRRMFVVTSLAGIATALALTGLAELTGTGSLSAGCSLSATSSLERDPVVPEDTTAFDPFEVRPDDWVSWTAGSDTVLTGATTGVGVRAGGFDLWWWEGFYLNSERLTEVSGTELVAPRTAAFHDRFGVPFSGVYHVVGRLDAAQGACDVDLYLRVTPATPLSGWLLLGLWATVAGLALALLVLTWEVRGSIRDADAYARAAHGSSRDDESPPPGWPELDEGD